MTRARRAVVEAVGAAFLLATVVGSGIMGVRLSHDIDGLALLANALATGAGLFALILAFGPLSGAHFNPIVTLASAFGGEGIRWPDVPFYLLAQVTGAFVGVMIAHVMFNEPVFQTSGHVRAGLGQLVSEFIATFGLVAIIAATRTAGLAAGAAAVSLYIASAYWFTASTSFANPAVTLARSATNTFAGIRPADVLPFVAAQCAGGAAATAFFRWLAWTPRTTAEVLATGRTGSR